jgi:HEAT repeat protein
MKPSLFLLLATLSAPLATAQGPATPAPSHTAGKAVSAAELIASLGTTSPADDPALGKTLDAALRAVPRAERTGVERQLLDLATRETLPVEARKAILDTLAWTGSRASVKPLARLADTPAVMDEAIRALAAIPGDEADQALVRLLQDPAAPRSIAVLDALGHRRSTAGVKAISSLLSASDVTVAAAACQALARIGSPDAAAALERWQAPEALSAERTWGLIAAAHQLSHDGKTRVAQRQLRTLLDGALTVPQRVATAEGLIVAGGPLGLSATEAVLADPKAGPRFASRWLRAAIDGRTGGSGKALASLERSFGSLPQSVQAAMLATAEQLANPQLLPVVRAGLASEATDVRRSALVALGACADTQQAAEPLFAALAHPEERSAVLAGLKQLRAPGTDERVRQQAAEATEDAVKTTLLEVASARVDRAIMPLVLEGARSDHRERRQASFRALETLVRGEDLPVLLELRPQLRTAAERRAWHEALINAVRFRSDGDATAALLAEHLPAGNAAERTTFAQALTLLPGDGAVDVLRGVLSGADVERRKEAIRGLAAARNARASGLLIEVAESGKDETERILALRGHLDALADLPGEMSAKAVAYRRAWKAATRDEERLAIISGVDRLWGPDITRLSQELHRLLPSAPPPPSRHLP